MDTWLLVVAIPVIVAWASKLMYPRDVTWAEFGIIICASVLVGTIVYACGLYSATYDVQILNGKVVEKARVEDTYLQSYSCNCRTTGGKHKTTHCDTCYRRHYTVKWGIQTTIGGMSIDSVDSTSRSIYSTPDPQRYTSILMNDPVSKSSSFTNYVKAVPESLFHFTHISPKFAQTLPEYPSDIYDIYRINRVIPVGVAVPDIALWNQELSHMLGELGPSKRVNAVVVIVNTADVNYINSLKTKWLNGKKNDVVVVIGTSKYPAIDWVQVMSWTDHELFKVQLRDEIFNLKTVDRTAVIGVMSSNITKSFIPKDFKDFEYLKYEIDPPLWVLWLAALLSIITSAWLSRYFYINQL